MTTCIYCGQTFDPPSKGTPMCRECYFAGRAHREAHRWLITELERLTPVKTVEVLHTGGGCFGLMVTMTDGTLYFGTQAYLDADGEWATDAVMPDLAAGDQWTVGRYASEEAFGEGEVTGWTCPACPEAFIAIVSGELAMGAPTWCPPQTKEA